MADPSGIQRILGPFLLFHSPVGCREVMTEPKACGQLLTCQWMADLGPVLGTETLEFTGVLVSDVKSHTRISLGKRSERGNLFS